MDSAGNAYVTGDTVSTEATFPVVGGPDLTFNGPITRTDAFVAKVNVAGTGLVYAGYIGGSNWDWGKGIAVDSAGNAYVTGYTVSTEATFPVTGGPDLTFNGVADAFVAKVSAEQPVSIPLAYIVISGPTAGIVNTAYTFTSTVSPITATQPITYFWQATRRSAIMHVGGLSDTVAFTWNTSGPKIITVTASNAGSIVTDTHTITIYAAPNAEFTASPTSGFAPLTVAFTNTSGDYTTSQWAFGDSATSSLPSPTHVYTTVGVYTVTLTVEGPLGSDTETKADYVTVRLAHKVYLPVVLRNP